MSIPQIQVALAGCDRRDAALALQQLDTFHAAMAPLMIGEKGLGAFDRCASALRAIIRPLTAYEKRKASVFGKLWAMASKKKPDKQLPPPKFVPPASVEPKE